MTLKTIYGRPVKDLANIRVVSNAEAKRLIEEAHKKDMVRMKFGLKPFLAENDK